jgi:hypothetical protein
MYRPVGPVFGAANQAATTWSVALNTTFTGLVLSNPAGSAKDLRILRVGFALSVAPVAIAKIGLFTGFLAAGIATHTTPLTPFSRKVGAPTTGMVAKADAAATLVGTPRWVMPILAGFTAGALPSPALATIDLDGCDIVPPGGYFGIGALTAVVGFGAIWWTEQEPA